MKILLTFDPVSTLLPIAEKEFTIVRGSVDDANAVRPEALLVAHGQTYDAAVVAGLPDSVRVIATCSVGFEHIDVAACAARGILATNTPDVLTEACADLTLFLILGAARRANEALALTRGGWGKKLQQGELLGYDLRGKRLGIFGMGRIGQAVAERARGFGMTILYSKRHRLTPAEEKGARFFASLEDMLPECDVLSVHAPGGPDTDGVMGSAQFAKMPKGSMFINTSRGTLVDEDALLAALDSGQLFAAALDVCRDEPNPDPRLLGRDDLFFTPHIASATEETRLAMGLRALENLRAALRGERPRDLLNAK